MTEIQFSTAGELAAEIRTGRVTSREVTEQLLDRIAVDSAVNAVLEVRREAALRAAVAGSGRESRRINFQLGQATHGLGNRRTPPTCALQA
ncbi:hypothetical protein ACXC9Q_22995 (plasmid) [Kribbella sp. CWNU-51]